MDIINLSKARSSPIAGSRSFQAWGWSIILAAIFVLIQIKASLWGGRLSLPPTYDDVGYFQDGALRLGILHHQGLLALLRHYVAEPPHSPLQTLLAMLGFSIFGIKPWAAAAATTLPIVLLIRLFFAVSGLPVSLSVLLAASFLLMPYAGFLAVEFRPDGFCGLFLSSGALIVTLTPWLERRLIQVIAGVLFAGALLAKPSVLPLTLVVMGVAMALTVLPRIREPGAWPAIIGAGSVTLGLALIISLPYYSVGLSNTINYIYTNAVSEQAIVWGAPLPLPERLAYYLTGPGAQRPVGWWLFVSLGTVILAVVLNAAAAKWSAVYRIGSAFLSATVAYSILTYTDNKSPYIGLGFTAFVFVGLLCAFVWFCRVALSKSSPAFAFSTAAALFLAALFTFHFPALENIDVSDIVKAAVSSKQTKLDRIKPFLHAAAEAQQTTSNSVADVLAAIPDLESKVIYTGSIADYVNPNTLSFMLTERGLPYPRWVTHYTSADLARHVRAINRAQYALLFSLDSDAPIKWLPNYGLREKLLEVVPNAGFEEIARVRDASGQGSVLVFQRRSRL